MCRQPSCSVNWHASQPTPKQSEQIELVDRLEENLSKLDTTIRHSSHVHTPSVFATWMANCAVYQASAYVCDVNNWESSDNPVFYQMFHSFASMVTSGQSRYLFKMCPIPPSRVLLWLTSVVDQATIHLTAPVGETINAHHILHDESDKIRITILRRVRT